VWYVAERAGGYQYHHPLILIWNALARIMRRGWRV
jgi:hypothetical protein